MTPVTQLGRQNENVVLYLPGLNVGLEGVYDDGDDGENDGDVGE